MLKTRTSFSRKLSNLLKARFPYIYIQTWEEERLIYDINSIVLNPQIIKTTRNVYVWSLTNGITSGGNIVSNDTKDPLRAIKFVENCNEPAVFIMKDFHIYFGASGKENDVVIRALRDCIQPLKRSQFPKSVIFVSPTLKLPVELQKDITVINFELPSQDEIKYLLDEMIEANKGNDRININLNDEDREKLSKAALGLTYQEAENAFARAIVDDGTLSIKDLDIILEEKRQVIKKTGILEFIKTNLSMSDVGGLENLKRWLNKRNNTWLDAAKKYCIPNPKGVLITGVPGCGKSLIAKAISEEWKLPLMKMDVGRIFSGIVGSSEENMRRAVRTAEAVAPCILWIDEIEKGFSGLSSSGDSGTTSRIFGTFLTWMQEKTQPVFVVATANNIYNLPSEFMRKGRFDEIFFVDLPTRRERVDIFKVHLNKSLNDKEVIGDLKLDEDTYNQLADLTEGFVGAEIEQIVISGLYEAFFDRRSVNMGDFEKAIKNTVPLAVTQKEAINSIRNWANVRAVAATPKDYLKEYNKNTVNIAKPKEDSNSFSDDVSSQRGGRAIDF